MSQLESKLTRSEMYRLVNDYIEVHGGYLGDFSYRTHYEFYPYYCDLDIDVSSYEPGTTREKFIRILEDASPKEQAAILKGVFSKYPVSSFPEEDQVRKQELFDEFQGVINRLRNIPVGPSDDHVARAIEGFDAIYIAEVWQQALERRIKNPDAAITSARNLLESVCKHILDDSGVEYEDKWDLPRLYKLTSEELSLAPSQHSEQIFKQILGGCQTVVEGLGSVRNKLGDAHGKGRRPVRPAPRHAELAVNLAGSMALFLFATWESNKGEMDQSMQEA